MPEADLKNNKEARIRGVGCTLSEVQMEVTSRFSNKWEPD